MFCFQSEGDYQSYVLAILWPMTFVISKTASSRAGFQSNPIYLLSSVRQKCVCMRTIRPDQMVYNKPCLSSFPIQQRLCVSLLLLLLPIPTTRVILFLHLCPPPKWCSNSRLCPFPSIVFPSGGSYPIS